jgi:hypothetical protein
MYTTGPYNKLNESEQWIRLTDGCPNKCPYCYAPEKLEWYEFPKLERNFVKIMDMNLLASPHAKKIIQELGNKLVGGKKVYYELICGIDYRYLTDEIAKLLKENRFINIRFAWDRSMNDQKIMKQTIKKLLRAGYKSDTLSCFMLCDWKISKIECERKLDLLKVWRVKVNDCWYDNATAPNYQLNNWSLEESKDFRRKCRRHNIMVRYGVDLTWKQETKLSSDTKEKQTFLNE